MVNVLDDHTELMIFQIDIYMLFCCESEVNTSDSPKQMINIYYFVFELFLWQ